ncbi:MAG: M23 family metallopeptidase [Bacteroidales bacterium]|nr:M23 family metallopeptidase [Bacteroidales bacterium]
MKNFSRRIYYYSVLIFALGFCFPFLKAQNTDKNLKNIFSSPLDIPLYSAGSFAELRGSHFHSGLDIRTQGKTGFNVYAPADGYVSRIKVQAYGGGKNLYITHPNGYTTVYMHLERYCGEIEEFVKKRQYALQVYEFDYVFPNPKITVKKGDTIAISGESGSAAGPHLLFEVRNSKTENPINALKFLDIEDTFAPNIESLAISPANDLSSVESLNKEKVINLNGKTKFKQGDTVDCLGKVFFSILAFDASKKSSSRNGVLSTELFINNKSYFSHRIDEFSFADYGFVDAVINYPLYKKTNKRYLCSKLLSNGKLPYDKYFNNGILEVKKDSVYLVEWVLKDIKNNTTKFAFYVRGYQSENFKTEKSKKAAVKHISFSQRESYNSSDGSYFIFPKNSLYEDIDLEHYERKGTYSDVHTLHNIYEPVKKKFTVKIKPYKFDKALEDKYIIVSVNSKGGLSSKGGFYKDGFVEATIGDFGTFAVWIDTTAPQIKALNFKNGQKISEKLSSVQVKISDNLSGIQYYKGYLNGKWILMEYDGKNARLTYFIDDKLKEGENTLKVVVTDRCENVKTEIFKIIK